MGRRYFSAEFKTEAVRQVVELRRPKAQVARDLGVHINVLKSWLNAYAKDPVGAFTGESVAAIERSEIARLQKELQRVRAERDILKKMQTRTSPKTSSEVRLHGAPRARLAARVAVCRAGRLPQRLLRVAHSR